jgi:hypothetical protein
MTIFDVFGQEIIGVESLRVGKLFRVAVEDVGESENVCALWQNMLSHRLVLGQRSRDDRHAGEQAQRLLDASLQQVHFPKVVHRRVTIRALENSVKFFIDLLLIAKKINYFYRFKKKKLPEFQDHCQGDTGSNLWPVVWYFDQQT